MALLSSIIGIWCTVSLTEISLQFCIQEIIMAEEAIPQYMIAYHYTIRPIIQSSIFSMSAYWEGEAWMEIDTTSNVLGLPLFHIREELLYFRKYVWEKYFSIVDPITLLTFNLKVSGVGAQVSSKFVYKRTLLT